ncbi:MAG: four helix bundle protein [Candidatus Omnitrophota bacterium]
MGSVAGNGKRQPLIVVEDKKRIRSFQDLDVYQTAYKAMLNVHKEILPKLPKEENYDLKDQLRRSTKAIPRLIAEGHSKRHQYRGFQKYIDDALAESNETIVSLCQARDLYLSQVDSNLCNSLIDRYDKISRQLYNLALSWDTFNKRNRKTINDSSCARLAE